MWNISDMSTTDLLRVSHEATRPVVHMRSLAKLANCLRLASLTLANNNARKVTVRMLLILRFMHRCPIIAACLISRWLLQLALYELISTFSLVGNTTSIVNLVALHWALVILRRDDLLFLLRKNRGALV